MGVSAALPARPRAVVGLTLLVALLALAAAGKAVLFDTIDPDCFLHLLAADQLTADGIGPLVDRQSFASIQKPWTPYSWLAELGMKRVWDTGGHRAAVAAHAVMAALVVTLTALACAAGSAPVAADGDGGRGQDGGLYGEVLHHSTRPAVPRLSAGVATAFAAFLSLPYLSFRPVTLAIVLLAATALILVRDRRTGERSRGVWLVPVLTLVMVNVHLFAIVVPMWLAALLGGAVWERRMTAMPPDWPEADRRLWRYAVLLGVSAAACLGTPMLPGFVDAVLHYQFGDAMVAGPVIAEYQPFYHGTMGRVSAGLVVASLGCVLLNRGRLRAGDFLWLLIGACLLLRLGRFSPVFAVGAAPLLAVTLPRLSDRLLARPPVWGAIVVVIGLGVYRIGAAFPRAQTTLDAWVNRHGPDVPGYPCAAADFVEHNVSPATGRIINEYTWGGYLEWRLGHRYQALLDGRTQLFSSEFWRATYLAGAEERKQFLTRVEADAAVVPIGKSIFRGPLVELGWQSAYRDDRAEVLIPPRRVNAQMDSNWNWATVLFGE